jgi:hypothetical protein
MQWMMRKLKKKYDQPYNIANKHASMSDESSLNQLKLADLKAQCKEKSLPISGTKAELIARLLGAPPAKKPRVAAVKTTKPVPNKPVFDKLLQSSARDPIIIKRNIHGHFEHPETRLVFSPQKKVIGRQAEDHPDIEPLTTQDLEQVYRFHFELDASVVVQDVPSVTHTSLDRSEERLDELLHLTMPQLYRQHATMDLHADDANEQKIE